jgi:hypothetical protein
LGIASLNERIDNGEVKGASIEDSGRNTSDPV